MAAEARADDYDPLLDVEAPSSLPSLTKREATLEFAYGGAGVARPEGGGAVLWTTHVEGEIPLTTRTWHAGIAWDVASAAAEGEGRALLFGNPELWLRAVGTHESGISAGGSVGGVIPMPQLAERPPELEDAVRVVKPDATGYFSTSAIVGRPAFDLRLVSAPFTFQLRQGLDFSYSFDQERGDVVARVVVYAGWHALPRTTLGVEARQVYSITADVRDDEPSAVSLSPSMRVRAGVLEPGFSLSFPVSTPLEGIATAYFAAQVHVRLALIDMTALTLPP